MMKLTLDPDQLDQAIKEYVRSRGFLVPLEPVITFGMVQDKDRYQATATVEIVGVK